MPELPIPPAALLLDIDGVLYVGDEPLPGAIEALERLRELANGVRLLTNTTSKPRRAITDHLRALGFDVAEEEVLTPAALAVAYCRSSGYRRVNLVVGDSLHEDLDELEVATDEEPADAVVLGDLGSGFTAATLNAAFRRLMDGAELIALQHNRYWRRADGLALDVGAYAAALEYASGVEPIVVGKPSREFFAAALESLGAGPADTVMVGDDIEGDIGGSLAAGIASILVRTGKYREDAVASSSIVPSATVNSIADLPPLLGG
ncbi:MAG TPA: TIGR01458 family HAD-type hydrolase [Solirubrobacterales bacterium]|nr:TIGR01458 family HAD-type hydrolase [Solirubrobacterales bacterium]